MKDRIKKIMESQEMTQKTFAEYLGISAASLSSIFTEKTKPTLSTVGAIMDKFPEISLDWLISGKGSMYAEVKEVYAEVKEVDEQPQSFSQPMNEQLDLFATPVAPLQQQKSGSTSSPTISTHKQEMVEIKMPAKREIKEIRIFFDDGTYETFTSSQK